MEYFDIIEKADEIWCDFRKVILYKNRFFIKHQLLDIIKDHIESNVINVREGEIFYRARIINEIDSGEHRIALYAKNVFKEGKNEYAIDNKENDFYGLSKEASFVPIDNDKIKDGRANPKFVKYLYIAKEPTTALLEVRPIIDSRVNLSKIRVNESLRVVDLTVDFGATKKLESVEKVLISYIQGIFSIPTNNSDDYIPTQIISEYIKNLDYDGIMFKSALHKGGINLIIYNYEKCEPINSRDYKIENMKLSARSTTPWGKDDFWYIKDNISLPLKFKSREI